MKILYYILFGWALLTAFSMIMRITSENIEIDLPFIAAIVIISWLGYFFLKKATQKKPGVSSEEESEVLKIPQVKVPPAPESLDQNKIISASTKTKVNYLLQADYLDQEILDSEKMLSWEEILADERTDEEFEEAIKDFLIPYRISVLKYSLNRDYYENPYQKLGSQDKHIAPSLKIIRDDFKYKVRFYPSWFYIAFPDVLKWAVDPNEGWPKVETILKPFSEVLLENQNHLLNKIIELFYNERQSLECEL